VLVAQEGRPMMDIALGLMAIFAKSETISELGKHVLGFGIHEKITELQGSFWERNRGFFGLPANHDVRKAVRTAEMQGLQHVCRDFEKRYGLRSGEATVVGRQEWLRSNARDTFITQLHQFIQRELPAVGHVMPDGSVEATEAVNAGERLIQDAIEHAQDRKQVGDYLRRKAEDSLLREIGEHLRRSGPDGKIPDEFITHFKGFEEQKDSVTKAISWFTAFSQYLAAQVKDNERFRVILQVNMLSAIMGTLSDMQNLLKEKAAAAADTKPIRIYLVPGFERSRTLYSAITSHTDWRDCGDPHQEDAYRLELGVRDGNMKDMWRHVFFVDLAESEKRGDDAKKIVSLIRTARDRGRMLSFKPIFLFFASQPEKELFLSRVAPGEAERLQRYFSLDKSPDKLSAALTEMYTKVTQEWIFRPASSSSPVGL
jgi:hypothetical protein